MSVVRCVHLKAIQFAEHDRLEQIDCQKMDSQKNPKGARFTTLLQCSRDT